MINNESEDGQSSLILVPKDKRGRKGKPLAQKQPQLWGKHKETRKWGLRRGGVICSNK